MSLQFPKITAYELISAIGQTTGAFPVVMNFPGSDKVGSYVNPDDSGYRLSDMSVVPGYWGMNDCKHLKVVGNHQYELVDGSLVTSIDHVLDASSGMWEAVYASVAISPTGYTWTREGFDSYGNRTFFGTWVGTFTSISNGHISGKGGYSCQSFVTGTTVARDSVPFSVRINSYAEVSVLRLSADAWLSILREHDSGPPINWSKLQQDACSGLQCNVNMLETAKDFIDLAQTLRHPLRSLSEMAQKVLKNPFRGTFSEVWMRWRYEQTTTLLDLQEVFRFKEDNHIDADSFLEASNMCHTVRSSERIGNTSYHFMMRLSQKSYNSYLWSAGKFAQMCDTATIMLRRYGLYPTAANLWDLVPLSFVVDWVIPVGDFLNQQEESTWWNLYFDLSHFCYSSKSVCEWNGYTISYYHRWTTPRIPQFEFYDSSISAETTVKRVIDGMCMLSS